MLSSATTWHGWAWEGWNALVAIGTIGLGLVTVLLWLGARSAAKDARKQLDEAQVATQLPALIELLGEYRSEALRNARHIVNQLPACDPRNGLQQLNTVNREAVDRVSHFLDNIGVLVSEGLLRPEALSVFLGGSAAKMWAELAPYIYAERRNNHRPAYLRHFEHLASVVDEVAVSEKIARLQRLPPAGVEGTSRRDGQDA